MCIPNAICYLILSWQLHFKWLDTRHCLPLYSSLSLRNLGFKFLNEAKMHKIKEIMFSLVRYVLLPNNWHYDCNLCDWIHTVMSFACLLMVMYKKKINYHFFSYVLITKLKVLMIPMETSFMRWKVPSFIWVHFSLNYPDFSCCSLWFRKNSLLFNSEALWESL